MSRMRSSAHSGGDESNNSQRTNKTHIVTINEENSKSQGGNRQVRSIEHDSPPSFTYWQQQPIRNISPKIKDDRKAAKAQPSQSGF
jgi:hypothetical protein